MATIAPTTAATVNSATMQALRARLQTPASTTVASPVAATAAQNNRLTAAQTSVVSAVQVATKYPEILNNPVRGNNATAHNKGNTAMSQLTSLIYAATLFYRGTDKEPTAERAEHFEQAELQRSVVGADGKKVAEKYQGWKRKDLPISVTYELPEGTPDWAKKAVESEIHLYVKSLADGYNWPAAVPSEDGKSLVATPVQLDVASFIDWITPDRSNDGIDPEFLKAGLAALKGFVLALTGKEDRASAVEYSFKNNFSTKAITSPKGFNVVATQVLKVLPQLGGLLGKFAESDASNGYESLIDTWATKLGEEITALEQGQAEENLFAL